jgi:acyl-CoA synthetase (AMP-forming)/AMP-acid ligase II
MILVDHFEATARAAPDRDFVYLAGSEAEGDAVLSYGEAERRASGIARVLAEHGIGRGDVVCLMLPNGPDWLVWYFGCQKVGAITCGLNTDLLVDDLVLAIGDTKARLIVSAPGLLDKARSVATGVSTRPRSSLTTGRPREILCLATPL